jgi:hypothetical protein
MRKHHPRLGIVGQWQPGLAVDQQVKVGQPAQHLLRNGNRQAPGRSRFQPFCRRSPPDRAAGRCAGTASSMRNAVRRAAIPVAVVGRVFMPGA